MKKRTVERLKDNPENTWYTVKFYHSRDANCPNKGRSEKIKFLTSSQAKLRVLYENANGGKYFCGQNCRKCGAEARITVL